MYRRPATSLLGVYDALAIPVAGAARLRTQGKPLHGVRADFHLAQAVSHLAYGTQMELGYPLFTDVQPLRDRFESLPFEVVALDNFSFAFIQLFKTGSERVSLFFKFKLYFVITFFN